MEERGGMNLSLKKRDNPLRLRGLGVRSWGGAWQGKKPSSELRATAYRGLS